MDYSKLTFLIGNIKFHKVSISKGLFISSIPSHTHSARSYEIHYIYEGQGKLIVNGKDYDLTNGTLYITGPNVYHEQLFVDTDPMAEICINFNVDTKPGLESNMIAGSFVEHNFWIGQDSENLSLIFEEMFTELKQDVLGSDLIIISLLNQLIIKIVRNYERFNRFEKTSDGSDINASRFLLIDQIFLSEYSTITLNDLANKISLSVRQTERLLKEYYNMNFQKKKLIARMAAAKLLLESTHKKTYEIAEITGYSTSEHFCNVFKKYYKVSTKAFRENSLNSITNNS
ncbi:MAG: AraC family transcriptional regulator [Mobilitalea sp.]